MTDLKAFRLKGERVKLDSEEFFFVKASILNSQTTTVRVRTAWNKRLPNKSSDCEPRTERSLDIACSISTQPGPIIAESMYTLPLLSQLNWDLLCSSPQFAYRREPPQNCAHILSSDISVTPKTIFVHSVTFLRYATVSYLSHYTIVAKLKCWKIIHKGLIWQYYERSEVHLIVKQRYLNFR